MPRITQASIGKLTIQIVTNVDVMAVTDTGDDLKDTVSTVTWGEEHSLNPQDTIGTGQRQYSDGKRSGTLTINGYPSTTDGFQFAVRSGGAMVTASQSIYMAYGATPKILKAIAKLISINNSVDAEGNATIETSWQSIGDMGILET